jgi:hypothetical protein
MKMTEGSLPILRFRGRYRISPVAMSRWRFRRDLSVNCGEGAADTLRDRLDADTRRAQEVQMINAVNYW